MRWSRRVSTPVDLKAPTICLSACALTSHGSFSNNLVRCPAGAGANDGVGRHRRHELGALCDCTRLQHGAHGPAAVHLVAAQLPEVFRTHIHPPETCMHLLADTSVCEHCHHGSQSHPHRVTPTAFSAPFFSPQLHDVLHSPLHQLVLYNASGVRLHAGKQGPCPI